MEWPLVYQNCGTLVIPADPLLKKLETKYFSPKNFSILDSTRKFSGLFREEYCAFSIFKGIYRHHSRVAALIHTELKNRFNRMIISYSKFHK